MENGKLAFTNAYLNETKIADAFNATIDFGYPLIAIPKKIFIGNFIPYLKKYSNCISNDEAIWHCEFTSANEINKLPYLILETSNFSYGLHWSNYTTVVCSVTRGEATCI